MPPTITLRQQVIEGTQKGPNLLILGGVHGDEFESMAAIRRLLDHLDPADFARSSHGHPRSQRGGLLARPAHGRGRTGLGPHLPGPARRLDHRTHGLRRQRGNPPGRLSHRPAQRRDRSWNSILPWGTPYIPIKPSSTCNGAWPERFEHAHHLGHLSSPRRTHALGGPRRQGASHLRRVDGGGTCDPQGADAYFEGCLNVLAELDMIDRTLPSLRTEYTVEDGRENSGHIQINYPAPFAGYFEPQVTLKAPVQPGDVIGTVVDHLGQRREEVVSTQEGLILCLRVFNRVHQGDSLAAVLELDPSQ